MLSDDVLSRKHQHTPTRDLSHKVLICSKYWLVSLTGQDTYLQLKTTIKFKFLLSVANVSFALWDVSFEAQRIVLSTSRDQEEVQLDS